jgi:DNA-directed RNA polymerase subunit M
VEFCKKCGGLMIVVGKRLKCRKCGWTKKLTKKTDTIKSEEVNVNEEIVILEEDEEKKMHPITRILCPKCGNTRAYWWMQQTRGADEPPTMFYKCTKCGYSWREY